MVRGLDVWPGRNELAIVVDGVNVRSGRSVLRLCGWPSLFGVEIMLGSVRQARCNGGGNI